MELFEASSNSVLICLVRSVNIPWCGWFFFSSGTCTIPVIVGRLEICTENNDSLQIDCWHFRDLQHQKRAAATARGC